MLNFEEAVPCGKRASSSIWLRDLRGPGIAHDRGFGDQTNHTSAKARMSSEQPDFQLPITLGGLYRVYEVREKMDRVAGPDPKASP